LNPAPLLPFWEKGLGDEGKLAKLGCTLDITIWELIAKLNGVLHGAMIQVFFMVMAAGIAVFRFGGLRL
jgi:hypothetical protein